MWTVPLPVELAAPPPTRRCARRGRPAHRDRGGSSAHAEMRRSDDEVWKGPGGLLRPRGDAPGFEFRGMWDNLAPPPTRRCARTRHPRRTRQPGSSAHAEMRPIPRRGTSARTWLLRPRGDAPYYKYTRADANRAPPPTRRCALRRVRHEVGQLGSSAHAEMRRSTGSRRTRWPRLLRPRGDAPHEERRGSDRDSAPPPTRRCALSLSARRARRGGSSAHAEMRPKTASPGRGADWLLRPRGDAPPTLASRTAENPAPPPTRRCAATRRRSPSSTTGSSAHAEMRPATTTPRKTR